MGLSGYTLHGHVFLIISPLFLRSFTNLGNPINFIHHSNFWINQTRRLVLKYQDEINFQQNELYQNRVTLASDYSNKDQIVFKMSHD